ncbi:hypothetical protein MAM1_0303d09456 [Mucor ambiguus]|uniref:Uncharacterized protein n=1 Tax=Mucor ambiguus TaxID=91626 RepID=A0A0C9N5R1_9FUNG|nr:hypothetical protein MAM1_0303d09456 [Mucor ambiguus]
MDSLLTLAVKDKCPQPTFYREEKGNALVIPLSQFKVDEFEKEGPTSFLPILRQQYSDGLRVSARKMSSDQLLLENYIEISFRMEELRKKALSIFFNSKNIIIIAYKTLDPRIFSAWLFILAGFLQAFSQQQVLVVLPTWSL